MGGHILPQGVGQYVSPGAKRVCTNFRHLSIKYLVFVEHPVILASSTITKRAQLLRNITRCACTVRKLLATHFAPISPTTLAADF